MDLNKAYATFGDVVPEVDDEMLWMAYTIGISDQPGQKDILREALQVIATHRKSKWIESCLANETAPGISNSMEIVPYSPPQISYDLPVGLNNIGNTCYLNSLLQYFFSVRELREALLRFHELEEDIDEHEVKEKKRVGGRIVSTPEILRSKQFASQLQGLFQDMMTTPLSAVSPERDLAFLALVLSKDESPLHPTGNNNHNSSASTDATLVDDRSGILGPTYNPTPSPPPMATSTTSSTVLGKRKSESSGSNDGHAGARNLMEVDSVRLTGEKDLSGGEEDLVMGGATPLVTPELQASKAAPVVIDLTDETTGLPPPLPPRPNRSRSLVAIDSRSHMMFGRQNDVSECMDNCLFQIQAALDPQKVLSSGICHSAQGNLIKSLFYGKTRQSLMFDNPKGKVSVKEEQFAYLLVDVAEEGKDLYDGLDKVFDESEVEVENGKACRRVGLIELPPILQIQLQRVQFDRRTHTVFKSNAHLKFGEQLLMDRYLEPDPDDEHAQEKRAKTVQLRKEIDCSRGRLSELTTNLSGDKRTASTILRDLHQLLSTSSDPTATHSRAASSCSTRMDLFNDILGQEELDFLTFEATAIDREIKTHKLNVLRLKAEIEEMWKIPAQEQPSEQKPENDPKPAESSSNDIIAENNTHHASASQRSIAEENRIGDQQKQQLVEKYGQQSEPPNLSEDKVEDNKEGETENLMNTDLQRNKEASIFKGHSYQKQPSTATSKNAEYMLVSLFMHRGTAQGGHYWAIQRQLPDRPNRWLKYNDSQVTEIDERVEIFKDQPTDQQMIENVDYANSNIPHSTAMGNDTVPDNSNPYWLTYVKVQEMHRFEMLKRVDTQKSHNFHNVNLEQSTVPSFNNDLAHHSSDPHFIS